MAEQRRRSARALALALAAALVLASCSADGEEERDAGRPSRRPRARATTTLRDYTKVSLRGVDGSTTTSIPTSGRTTLAGVVVGPSGPVTAATVRVERFVFDQIVRTDVSTDGAGRFRLARVPGGIYRVRAFKVPHAAQLEPVIAFVEDGDTQQYDLRVQVYEGYSATAAVAPPTPLTTLPVNVVVQLEQRRVDADGVVRAVPVAAAFVELVVASGRWSFRSASAASTDAGGRARFQLTCDEPGPPSLLLRTDVRGTPFPLSSPDCVSSGRAPTTTSSSTSPALSSTSTSSTTSTTRASTSTSSSTSTTSPTSTTR